MRAEQYQEKRDQARSITSPSKTSGIPNAIKTFEMLKKKGHRPIGIRLDSGDLAYLSIQAAKILNDAGFTEEKIVLSNELDEMNIWQIITQIIQEAPKYGLDPDSLIKRLGVGTRLITSSGDPALGGVYKLVAVKNSEWDPVIKISETPEKIPLPGNKQVWRMYNNNNKATADLIGLNEEEINSVPVLSLHHPTDPAKHRKISQNYISKSEPLLVEILKDGKHVYNFPSIDEIRNTLANDLELLDPGVKRLINPHVYHVSLTNKLWDLKMKMIDDLKNE